MSVLTRRVGDGGLAHDPRRTVGLAAKWALGWMQIARRRTCLMVRECVITTQSGCGFIPNVTPTEWQNDPRRAHLHRPDRPRSDAVASRIFDAANGSVTDSAGKIATVPNPTPQPAVHRPACVPEEIARARARR